MQNTRISFEFFPPKTADGQANLIKAANQLKYYAPEFTSVTFGACGATRDGTLATANKLAEIMQVPVAPHLSCIGYKKPALQELLQHYQAEKYNRLVALRGDLPEHINDVGDFNYAYELVEFIRATTGDHFHIEVAAYPECHPLANNLRADITNLYAKFKAGANCAITQYFFNPDAYFNYVDECSRAGIDMPIIPGIMPITHIDKLIRFSKTCGAEVPLWLMKQLQGYDDDLRSMQSFCVEFIYNLCSRLLAGGAPGLHFYTLNQADSSAKILDALAKSELPNKHVRKSTETVW